MVLVEAGANLNVRVEIARRRAMLYRNFAMTLKAQLYFLLGVVLAVAFSTEVIAHSGGLNSSGCHGGSRPYHCHRAASEMVGNRLRCDLGSKSRECIDRPAPQRQPQEEESAGAGSKSSGVVLELQIQLIRHCQALPSSFADGFWGPKTQGALQVFQASHGLFADGIPTRTTLIALKGPVTGRCDARSVQ